MTTDLSNTFFTFFFNYEKNENSVTSETFVSRYLSSYNSFDSIIPTTQSVFEILTPPRRYIPFPKSYKKKNIYIGNKFPIKFPRKFSRGLD